MMVATYRTKTSIHVSHHFIRMFDIKKQETGGGIVFFGREQEEQETPEGCLQESLSWARKKFSSHQIQ